MYRLSTGLKRTDVCLPVAVTCTVLWCIVRRCPIGRDLDFALGRVGALGRLPLMVRCAVLYCAPETKRGADPFGGRYPDYETYQNEILNFFPNHGDQHRRMNAGPLQLQPLSERTNRTVPSGARRRHLAQAPLGTTAQKPYYHPRLYSGARFPGSQSDDPDPVGSDRLEDRSDQSVRLPVGGDVTAGGEESRPSAGGPVDGTERPIERFMRLRPRHIIYTLGFLERGH
eukprot:1182413-Prorocentrum_minimum.AAC.1